MCQGQGLGEKILFLLPGIFLNPSIGIKGIYRNTHDVNGIVYKKSGGRQFQGSLSVSITVMFPSNTSFFSAKCLGRKSLSPLYHLLFISFNHCLPSSLHPSCHPCTTVSGICNFPALWTTLDSLYGITNRASTGQVLCWVLCFRKEKQM